MLLNAKFLIYCIFFSNVNVSKIGVYFLSCIFTVPFCFCLKTCYCLMRSPTVLGISTSGDEGQQHPLEMKVMSVTAASPKHQHLPWLWHRRGHRSQEASDSLPPVLHGPLCAGPSPRVARKQRSLTLSKPIASDGTR